MKISTGEVKISVWLEEVIGFDEDYFIPRFEKELVKGELVEWSIMGTAFDCYLILLYDSITDFGKYIERDLAALQKVVNRNKKRLMPRSDHNERMIMNVTSQVGTLCDNWLKRVNERV